MSELKNFKDLKDQNGYKKKDREWIDNFKCLYADRTLEELINIEKEYFAIANNISDMEKKVQFVNIVYYNNQALWTAIKELREEKMKGGNDNQ